MIDEIGKSEIFKVCEPYSNDKKEIKITLNESNIRIEWDFDKISEHLRKIKWVSINPTDYYNDIPLMVCDDLLILGTDKSNLTSGITTEQIAKLKDLKKAVEIIKEAVV